MLTPDIQKKISLLQLHVKKLLKSIFAGDYRSHQKGYGIEFEQLRDYQLGDDIRFIDWKSSARANKMLVKEYLHEHNKTILIAVDISASCFYSSSAVLKREFMAQIASVLALAADFSKARVGMVLFSDEVELYLPPGSGAAHVSALLAQLWSTEPKNKKTHIARTLKFLAQISKKDTMLFVISDFLDMHEFQKELAIVAQRYDLIAMRCMDPMEQQIIPGFFLHAQDCETGQEILLDCRKNSSLVHFLKKRLDDQNKIFRKYAIDCLDLRNNKSMFIDSILLFFAKRLAR